jgi:hypothetical protein
MTIRERSVHGSTQRSPTQRSSTQHGTGQHGTGQHGTSQHGHTSMPAEEAAGRCARYIARLTGKDPETVTAVTRSETGWTVGVEVVEDRRVPSSSDVLASYEAEIDADGEIAGYRRVSRYLRGSGGTEGSPR